jgi:hypothetical protein
MDDVYAIAVDIYARAVAGRMQSGKPKISASKQLAIDALNYAIAFVEATHEQHIDKGVRKLPKAKA